MAGVLAVVGIGVAALVLARNGFLRPGSRVPAVAVAPGLIRSIAVLPLDNYSGDPNQDYFAEGMTDELTADLATISQLRVISRGSVMQFRGKDRPPTPDIARKLNVDAVVEGSVSPIRRQGADHGPIDRRAGGQAPLWAKSFERSSRDVLALQAELASAIAREINVRLTPSEQSRLTTAPSVNPEAHDAYLKGRYFFNRPSDENLQKAIAQFEEAVRLSPTFAPAFSGLSDAYLWAGYNEGFLTATEARPKAKATAEKAVELDDNSAEAHTSLAVFKLFYEYDLARVRARIPAGIHAQPQLRVRARSVRHGARLPGTVRRSDRRGHARDRTGPAVSPDPGRCGGPVHVPTERRGGQETHTEGSGARSDVFFPVMIDGWTDLEVGKFRDAIPALKKAKTMQAPPFVTAYLAFAYGAAGDPARATAELAELKKMSKDGTVLPFNLALVYLGLGDRARALDNLERALAADSQMMAWIGRDTIFDPIRSEPRFVALLKKMGFTRSASTRSQ